MFSDLIKKLGNDITRKLFTPLEKAADFNRRLSSLKTNGGLMPSSAQIVRECNSLTGFTLKFNVERRAGFRLRRTGMTQPAITLKRVIK